MYSSLFPILPLSPQSEYSSESSLTDPTANLMSGNSPSPSPELTTSLYYNDYSPLTPIQPASATEAGPSHARFSSTDVFNNHHFSSSSSSRHFNYGPGSSSSTRPSVPVPQHLSYGGYGDYPASSSAIPPSTSTNHASLTTANHSLPRNTLSNFANLSGAGGVGASSTTSNSGLPNAHYDSYLVEHSSPLTTSAPQPYLEQPGRSGQEYPSSSTGLHGSLRHDPLYELKNPSYTTLPSLGDVLGTSSSAGPTRNLRAPRTTAPYSVPSISSRARNAASPTHYEDASVSLPTGFDASRDNAQTSPRRSSRSTQPRRAGSGSGVPLEKNFACKTCGLKFARNHDLTRHHKVHDPIKHYRCKGCDRSFTRRDALKRHNTQKNCGNEEDPQPASGSGRGRRRAATVTSAPPVQPDEYLDGPPPLTRASLGSVQTGIPVSEAYYGSEASVGRSNSGYIATGMESIARANKLEDSDRYSLRPARQHHPRSAHAYAPYGSASQQP